MNKKLQTGFSLVAVLCSAVVFFLAGITGEYLWQSSGRSVTANLDAITLFYYMRFVIAATAMTTVGVIFPKTFGLPYLTAAGLLAHPIFLDEYPIIAPFPLRGYLFLIAGVITCVFGYLMVKIPVVAAARLSARTGEMSRRSDIPA